MRTLALLMCLATPTPALSQTADPVEAYERVLDRVYAWRGLDPDLEGGPLAKARALAHAHPDALAQRLPRLITLHLELAESGLRCADVVQALDHAAALVHLASGRRRPGNILHWRAEIALLRALRARWITRRLPAPLAPLAVGLELGAALRETPDSRVELLRGRVRVAPLGRQTSEARAAWALAPFERAVRAARRRRQLALAYWRFMAACAQLGRDEQVLELGRRLRRSIEYPLCFHAGQHALIEEARALWGEREIGAALYVLSRVASQATPAGERARRMMGHTHAPPSAAEQRLHGDAARSERRWDEALRRYRLAIERSTGREREQRLPTWTGIAQCYEAQGLRYAACLAWLEASREATRARRPIAASWAYRALETVVNGPRHVAPDRRLVRACREQFEAAAPYGPPTERARFEALLARLRSSATAAR